MPNQIPPTGNIVKKLAQVMSLVGKMPKNGVNEHFKYKFVKEADLVEKLSELLAERYVFITSNTKGVEVIELSKPTRNGEIVSQKIGILRVEYTFHDGESGETLTMESVGEIDQDGGKGLYKALTGSMKYFLMKNFLVATGDDPEQSQSKPQPEKQAAPQKPSKQPPTASQVMEHMTVCQKLQPLHVIYTKATTKYQWSAEDIAKLNACFLSVYARLSNWELQDGTKFFSNGGLMTARVERDEKTGRVSVIENVAAQVDQEMAEKERAGKQAESDKTETPPAA